MRHDLPLAALLVPLALLLAGCGVSDTRYKAALDEVARRDAEAKASRAQAELLAGKLAKLEQRLAKVEKARREAISMAWVQRAQATAQAEARGRLESELDAALAEAHRAAARIAELAEAPVEPWRPRACSPLGALLREAGLCAVDTTPDLVSVGGPPPEP